jgi:hypothetical protein
MLKQTAEDPIGCMIKPANKKTQEPTSFCISTCGMQKGGIFSCAGLSFQYLEPEQISGAVKK